MTQGQPRTGQGGFQFDGNGPVERVAVDSLVRAGSPRLAGENEEHARILADSDTDLPPIVVHRHSRHVIDGLHRLAAAVMRGDSEISVVFYDGSQDDAYILAVQANVEHGLPLSRADRTAAAERVIGLRPHWSDRAIARVTGLSPKTVGAIRRRSTEENTQLNARVGRDGRIRPLDAGEGRRRAGELLEADPRASIRQIARQAGISQGTARDVRDRLQRGESPAPAQRVREDAAPQIAPETRSAKQESDVVPRRMDRATLMQNLKRDPSLRFNEIGRGLIRLLDSCPADETERTRLIENVPAHCAGSVAELAEMYAQIWQDFATKLRKRKA